MLSIASWNVLWDSDGCIDEHMRNYAPETCLAWEYRCAKIASHVNDFTVDVAVMVEVSHSMFNDLRRRLPDFDGWHAKDIPPYRDSLDQPDLCLFIRLDTVKVVDGPICRRLHDGYKEEEQAFFLYPKHSDDDLEPSAYALLSVAVQHCDAPSKPLVIGGVHLRWEFGSMPAAKAKPLQAESSVRALVQHAQKVSADAWALCGDFNSLPGSDVYHLLTHGNLPRDHHLHPGGPVLRDLTIPEAMLSSWVAVHGKEPLFTRKKNSLDSQFCLDYIFLGGVLASGKGHDVDDMPYTQNGLDLIYLPCLEWPSDHLPIVARLALCESLH